MTENATATAPAILDDGQLHFRIAGQEAEQAVDVLLLRLTCDECAEMHHLAIDANNCYRPTAAFLLDLTARITALGVTGCTASVARQLWAAAVNGIEDLKKNASETPSSDSGSTSSPEAPATTDY
jgi:hypothetical protein